jgi:hypothetical protein
MTAAVERSLWGLAAAVSVALHIALAAVLFLIPVPQSASSAGTHIVLLSSESRAAPVVSSPSPAIAAEALPAVSAVTAPPVATGIELSRVDRTMPGRAIAARQDVAAAIRADSRRIEPLPGLETSAFLRDGAVVVPSPPSSSSQPRPSPEIAGPAMSSIARQAVGDAIRAEPSGSGRVVASPSMPEPVQPTVATSGAAASTPSRPHPPAQAVAPSPAEAVDRRAPALREPATSPVPPGAPERVAAIMRPVEPLIARSREEVESAYADLLSTLRASRDEGCLLTLARLVGQTARIDGFVPAAADVSQLDQALMRQTALPVDLQTHAVTPDQCAALDFAAAIAGYPEPVLSIELVAA